ncbi:MAG: catalase [Rhodocyclales bacterium GWA2_65_19]|nr:MAG: catalase [Rhodocyclales bacterium GWA2_65_19]
MAAPSTQWQERIAPDEAERHAGYARDFEQIQAIKSAKYGNGRALHRKQQLGLYGSFEVLSDLPEHARHGLFAAPGVYETWVRLSNGGTDRQADRKPDIRGFAIKVRGVSGPGALGAGPAASQDFLLINHPAFAFAGADEFVGLVKHMVRGPGALFGYLVSRYGLLGALGLMKRFAKTFKTPFTGFATQSFYSAVPIACGPYAARVRMLAASDQVKPGADGDWAGNFRSHLDHGPLRFALQLQFFVDETLTPIEDASQDWAEDVAPYVTVGVLTLPVQDALSGEGQALAAAIESAAFDPWNALMANRPLGEVMRARKVVYYQSQSGRRPQSPNA